MNIPGANIRTLRQQMNISLNAMAEALGMDKGGLSKMERGEQGYSRELIERVAKILGVSVGVLFAEPATVEGAAFRMRRIPVLTPEELLHWRGPDGPDVSEESEMLYGSLKRMSRYVFAIRVPSPHAWPPYRTGDELIFEAKVQPKRGQIVAAQDGAGVVYIGRLRTLDASEFEVWPHGALDPAAASSGRQTLTLRGVLVEERRLPQN